MRILATLLGYISAIALLVGVLTSGVFWLVRSDPTLIREARAVPIPPRIAESIERQKVPEPLPEPIVKPPPRKATLQEATVSLTTQPARQIRIPEMSTPPSKKRQQNQTARRTYHIRVE